MCASLVSTFILLGKNLIRLTRLEKAHGVFYETLIQLEQNHYKQVITTTSEKQPLNVPAAAKPEHFSIESLSPEQRELYHEYVSWVYNSTEPKLGYRYADPNFSCDKVYCGHLGDEGMSNTLFSFLGLLMVAYRDDACVCDPTILIDHPRNTNISARRRKLSEFMNVTYDPDGQWRRLGLPPVILMSDEQSTHKITSAGADGNELFELVHYTNKYLHKARKLGMRLPMHPVISNYFKMIFRYPSEHISKYVNSFPRYYTAIHARVEHDFRTHHSGTWNSNGKDVKQILKITHTGLRELMGHYLEENAIDYIVVAVSIDNVKSREVDDPDDFEIGEEIYKDLHEMKTFWGASMQLTEKSKQLSYFERSLVDMLVCQRATYFVGHFWSTFSETVALVRQEKASTFHYGSGKLIPFEKSDNLLVVN